MRNSLWPRLLPCIYLAISLPIFYKVYRTSTMVIDEEFHLRQGKYYCIGKFGVWDPKITTFPGLYLASCLLLPFKLCTTFYLRMVSLLASVLNFVLIQKIKHRKQAGSSWLTELDCLNIAILPPMYFFSHLYYTDILSISTILGLYYFWDTKQHFRASLFAVFSVLMRQTNIIWVIFLLGISSVDEVVRNYSARNRITTNQVDIFNIQHLLGIFKDVRTLAESILNILRTYHGYIAVVIAFLVFVFLNGSIVIGDKSAHTAVLHVPQIFYFAIFFLVFGVSTVLTNCFSALRTIKTNFLAVGVVLPIALLLVNYNTLVHPYLLADNRHYIFYIWSRFYGKFEWFKYSIVPLYIFGLCLIHTSIRDMSKIFKLMFWVCTFLVLVPQKLLEIRYFLIPFLILRLNTSSTKALPLIAELFVYLSINALTFYIFFTKEIYWQNYKEPQRLIW